MRLRGIFPRRRFLFAQLWDKLSQGAGRLPRVPLPAALHIVSRNPTTKNDMEVHTMTIINLRDFYYWYTQDEYMEVSDDVAEALRASVRYEAAYQRRLSRHKAQYSLDCEDGIEYSACLHEPTPDEVLERKERFCRLWNALNSLPPAQGRRVDACVILGKSFSEVALAEGVDESAVRRAVERGLENMKKFLKNSR